jgi:transposase InsO family protein
MQIKDLFYRIRGYRRYQDMLYSLRQYEGSDIAKQRMKIIQFYNQYGECATKEAFGADRKVINRWEKRLKGSEGRLQGLIPSSTRPHKVRQSYISLKIIEFIKKMREEHPRIGKEKLKIFVDRYCKENRLETISASTIGNIIKRHHFFFQHCGRIYHDPDSKWACKSIRKVKRLRVRHPLKAKELGHILSDTVERVTDGIKDYFYSAIDSRAKFAITLNYKRLNSRNMKDFYRRFKDVYPYPIKDWQSDNGCENLGEFEEQLKQDSIPHYFSYPHCPKVNAYIERYNRTLQEEFIDNHLDIINDKVLFAKALADYLIFYNAQRPHCSLDLKAPLQYLVANYKMSHRSLTYTIS